MWYLTCNRLFHRHCVTLAEYYAMQLFIGYIQSSLRKYNCVHTPMVRISMVHSTVSPELIYSICSVCLFRIEHSRYSCIIPLYYKKILIVISIKCVKEFTSIIFYNIPNIFSGLYNSLLYSLLYRLHIYYFPANFTMRLTFNRCLDVSMFHFIIVVQHGVPHGSMSFGMAAVVILGPDSFII